MQQNSFPGTSNAKPETALVAAANDEKKVSRWCQAFKTRVYCWAGHKSCYRALLGMYFLCEHCFFSSVLIHLHRHWCQQNLTPLHLTQRLSVLVSVPLQRMNILHDAQCSPSSTACSPAESVAFCVPMRLLCDDAMSQKKQNFRKAPRIPMLRITLRWRKIPRCQTPAVTRHWHQCCWSSDSQNSKDRNPRSIQSTGLLKL